MRSWACCRVILFSWFLNPIRATSVFCSPRLSSRLVSPLSSPSSSVSSSGGVNRKVTDISQSVDASPMV
ncbi:MAG TPA: hypothetical protein DCW74_13300 [Alteromonas australica]|uniref:Secreted protein n=1 Tax=Alteromonas australica TaxID=589873 RepID=A0A358E190_9ALTE|nr:hypothetical protein [Alteromonas australica]HAU28157.1 hypothetical protein [Alteromonas australica]HAW76699.1 hypothetical protein [Alteromonas australica]HBF72342.1 hypothetical protein [Alteromonas australica]HBU51942.1 hypothetical protein [Alteromonas australica]